MEQQKEYLSTDQVVTAGYPFTKSWLDKARVRGGGPAYLKIGSKVYYRKDDLECWIAAHERRSTSVGISEVAA